MLHILALGLLIPFLCASLVSPGTMPSLDRLGRLTVTICATAPGVMLSPAQDPRDDKAAQPCIWGLHGQPLALAAAPVLPALPLSDAGTQAQAAPMRATPAGGLPPQARGPPIRS